MLLVPAVIQTLLATPGIAGTDFSSVRAIVYGASPITDDILVKGLQRFGCKFLQVYGFDRNHRLHNATRRPRSGTPARTAALVREAVPVWLDVRIVDNAGADVPNGTVGELSTRSAQNMLGYWHNPAATAATVTPDGWLKTGDAGYLDSDGYIHLHDRVKDPIG
jgi:long-chain acyl-CoA synthetase